MAKKLKNYKQTAPKYKNKFYGVKGKEKTTIGDSGCGPTCAAMIVATYEDPNETPIKACEWSMKHGYKAVGQGTFYSFFVPYFKAHGITCRQVPGGNSYGKKNTSSDKEALKALKAGKYVIAVMGPGLWTSSGHFIVVRKYKGGTVWIQDPASTKAARLKNTWNKLQTEAKYYWIIDPPKGRIMYAKEETPVRYYHKKTAKVVRKIKKDTRVVYDKKAKKWVRIGKHEWVHTSRLKARKV